MCRQAWHEVQVSRLNLIFGNLRESLAGKCLNYYVSDCLLKNSLQLWLCLGVPNWDRVCQETIQTKLQPGCLKFSKSTHHHLLDANNLKYLEAKSFSSIFWKYFLPRATYAANKPQVRNESNQKKMQQNLKSIGNIDVKVNPRLSHFRSPDKIALVQYESTQRKMQKSQKAWNWLGGGCWPESEI